MLVIQPLLLSAFSSLYWQSLGNPPGDARAEEKPLPTLSGSYFVTANPRYIYSALADAAPIGDARSSRDPLPLRDKFSHFDIPAGRIQRGRVRLRTRRACSATMHRRRYKARGGMHPQRQMQQVMVVTRAFPDGGNCEHCHGSCLFLFPSLHTLLFAGRNCFRYRFRHLNAPCIVSHMFSLRESQCFLRKVHNFTANNKDYRFCDFEYK